MSCVCCSGGTNVCVIPSCLTDLDLGSTTEIDGSLLWLRMRNESTGYTEQVEVTVTGGRVIAPVWMFPESFINAFAFFTAWVSRQDDKSATELPLTPRGTIYSTTCFSIKFRDLYEGEIKFNYAGLIIELEV